MLSNIFNRRFFYCLICSSFVNIVFYNFLNMTGGGVMGIREFILIPLLNDFIIFYWFFYLSSFLPKTLLHIFQIFLVFLASLMALVDCFLIFTFQTTLTLTFFEIFLSTNPQEAQEFLSFYSDTKILGIVGIFILFSLAFFLIPIKTPTLKPHPKIAFALFIIMTIGVGNKALRVDDPINYYAGKTNLIRWAETVTQGIISQNAYIAQYRQLREEMNENLSPSYPILENSLQLPRVILIIGESTQRHFMSLYGYNLPTTPHLDELKTKGNLFVFNDVIAPFDSTDTALSKVLTFSRYENASTPWFKQQNLIDVMKLSGYHSIWLSNQEAVSIWGNAPEIIAQRANQTHFTTYDTTHNARKTYDEFLVSMLNKLSIPQDSKLFYIFHLMGTHTTYSKRYPKSFDTFSAEDMLRLNAQNIASNQTSFELTKKQAQTQAEYANAILYNDFVLDSIIQRFANEESIIFFLSDHGDEVYNFRNFSGHSGGAMSSRFMIEIPFFIYMSDTFKQKYPHIVQKVQNAQNLPFMTDDFIHAFLDLLGIKTPDTLENASPFSTTYHKNRARIFAGKDYDKQLKDDNKNHSFIVPSKLWLHQVDEVAKFCDFYDKYYGFEINVHFLDTPVPHFDVGHDGLEKSIGLDLDEMFRIISQTSLLNSQRGGG